MRQFTAAFDRLLNMVSPHLTKTSWRKAIEPGERLAITLRYDYFPLVFLSKFLKFFLLELSHSNYLVTCVLSAWVVLVLHS